MQLTLPPVLIALMISGTHSSPIPGVVARSDDYTTSAYCLLQRGFETSGNALSDCPDLRIKRDDDTTSNDHVNLREIKREDSDWSSSDFMNLGELKRDDGDWSSSDFMNLGEIKRDDSDWSSSDFMNLGEIKR